MERKANNGWKVALAFASLLLGATGGGSLGYVKYERLQTRMEHKLDQNMEFQKEVLQRLATMEADMSWLKSHLARAN